MTSLTLVIGNKNYSSWSLRPWLVLRQADIPFEEVRIPLYRPESSVPLAAWSPSGLVPALHDGDIRTRDARRNAWRMLGVSLRAGRIAGRLGSAVDQRRSPMP